jgi:putative DNA primase/helicase
MLDWQRRAPKWPADPAAAEADRQARIRLARDIWGQARPAPGTVVERYLRSRGISIPIPPAAIRHLPPGHCYSWHPWSGERRPVMVAAVEHIEHGLVAVHRTWLAQDGSSKATISPERVSTGPVGGGAVRLGGLLPNIPLVIAEGVETGLAATELTGWPTWAALSAVGIQKLVLPIEAREVVIFVDRDRDGWGERAARQAASYWAGDDRRVELIIPNRIGADANDLLREARHAG